MKSHPTWVRGLKRFRHGRRCAQLQSHPTWVRGLKLTVSDTNGSVQTVAPYVGAWIET